MVINENFDTGIAVKIESFYGSHKLTHVSFDVDHPEDGNTVIEVRHFNSLHAAEDYARKCLLSPIITLE